MAESVVPDTIVEIKKEEKPKAKKTKNIKKTKTIKKKK